MSNNKKHSSVYYDEQTDRIQNNRERYKTNTQRENSAARRASGNSHQGRISSEAQRPDYRKSEVKNSEGRNISEQKEQKKKREQRTQRAERSERAQKEQNAGRKVLSSSEESKNREVGIRENRTQGISRHISDSRQPRARAGDNDLRASGVKNKPPVIKKKSRLPGWFATLSHNDEKEDIIRVKGGFDRPMFFIVMVLIGFGLIMVFSASYAYALSKTGDSLYFIKHQAIFAVLGIGAMIVMMKMDYRIIYRFTIPLFIITSILLIVTPIYGMAAGVAKRWIEIGGIRFQPSEIMKLVLVLFLARYYAIYEKPATNYSDFWQSSVYGLFIPAGFVLFVCVLIMLENHFSGMIIMFLIGMIVIFAAGARKIWFIVAGSSAAVAAAVAISLSSYARERIDVWLHPENFSADDEVYQTLQGLYAVGSGGLFGTGLGNSRQKHLFVSQPQNDFIFSIICEELGFIGAIGVIALFILLVWRGVVIALRAPDTFSQLVVIGIVGKVAVQALLNIGVVTALLPNTGISLPFFSYGGTALALQIAEMGIVLGISRYSRH